MKALFLTLFALCALTLDASAPYLEIVSPDTIAKNLDPNLIRSNEQKDQDRAVKVIVHPGNPIQGWQLFLYAKPKVSEGKESVDIAKFPLFWREEGRDKSFKKVYSQKTLVKEQVSGEGDTLYIDILIDPTWEIFPGTYQTEIYFSLESLTPIKDQ